MKCLQLNNVRMKLKALHNIFFCLFLFVFLLSPLHRNDRNQVNETTEMETSFSNEKHVSEYFL